jgi:hypothetical protein
VPIQKLNLKNSNWIGHILRADCLLKHIIARNIKGRREVMGSSGRICEEPLDGPKEKKKF